MSFGAASQRGRALPVGDDCACGGGRYGHCCGPILAGRPANTAEALVRSRFTAFATGDTAHLLATWHPTTAPQALDPDADLTWERLDIVRTDGGSADDTRGIVEFRAHWRDGSGGRGTLHEASRFRRAAGRWYYVDGDVESS